MSNTIEISIHGKSTRYGQGGWGAVLLNRTKAKYRAVYGGAIRNTTDGHMEIMSAIQALGLLKRPLSVDLYTESDLIRRILEERFILKQHKTLCLELRYLATVHNINVIRVQKHTDKQGDPRVYSLVHEGIQKAKEMARIHKGMLHRIPNHF